MERFDTGLLQQGHLIDEAVQSTAPSSLDWEAIEQDYLAGRKIGRILSDHRASGLTSHKLRAMVMAKGWAQRHQGRTLVGVKMIDMARDYVTAASVARALSRTQVYNAERYYSWAERCVLMHDYFLANEPKLKTLQRTALLQRLDLAVAGPAEATTLARHGVRVKGLGIVKRSDVATLRRYTANLKRQETAALLGHPHAGSFEVYCWAPSWAARQWLERIQPHLTTDSDTE